MDSFFLVYFNAFFATTLGTLAMDVQSKCRDASCQVVLDLV